MTPEAALSRLLAAIAAAGRHPRVERVALDEAHGRVLVHPVRADRDQPPVDRARMDGYALRAVDARPGAVLPVHGTCPAGVPAPPAPPPGGCIRIATGAALPTAIDCVIPHERTDRGDPVTLQAGVPSGAGARWHAVHRAGSDARRGDIVLAAGVTMGPVELAAAAAVGATTLDVAARPRVTLLSSGDEIVPPDASPRLHEIRETNRRMLASIAGGAGAHVTAQSHVHDDLDAARSSVQAALADTDVLVTIGGISAGDRDHFPAAFVAAEIRTIGRRIAIRPGGPTMLGITADGIPVIAAPGNPVSALMAATLFLVPVIQALCGAAPRVPWRTCVLAAPDDGDPASDDAAQPARVMPGADGADGPAVRRAVRPARFDAGGRLHLVPWNHSGDLLHLVGTDGAVEVPAARWREGDPVRFLPWPPGALAARGPGPRGPGPRDPGPGGGVHPVT